MEPDNPVGAAARARRSEVKSVLLEALVVALAGGIFALAANQISPRGLKLTRNYFPGSKPGSVAAVPINTNASPISLAGRAATSGSTSNANVTENNVPSDSELLAARLRDNGLHLIQLAQVRLLAVDPGVKQGLILFINARNPESYAAGHIPGAREFDPYHPEKYAGVIVPLCQAAQKIIVYCTGGECEDSEFAAISLRDTGIPAEKLFVYGGGITEWQASRLPVETGGETPDNTKQ